MSSELEERRNLHRTLFCFEEADVRCSKHCHLTFEELKLTGPLYMKKTVKEKHEIGKT